MNKNYLLAVFLFLGLASSINAQNFSLRTNLVGLATLNFNLEPSISWGTKNQWSVQLPVQLNPFVLGSNAKFQNITVQPGVRYWLLDSYMKNFIGLNLIASDFHMGNILGSKWRYEGTAYGAGVSFGYAKPISKRWNIELEAGIGAVKANYTQYECKSCGRKIGDYNKWMVVPSKLSAAIVYLF